MTLLHWYKLDDNGGTAPADSAGSATGSFSGSGQTWVAGQVGTSALSCTASGSVSLGAMDDLEGIAAATIAFWGKRNATSALCCVGKYNGATNRFALSLYTDGIVYFDIFAASVQSYGTVAHNDTAWHHWVFVYDGGAVGNARIRGWRDAIEQTLTYTGTAPTTLPSGTLTCAINAFDAEIGNATYDEVRLYNHALTQSEIDAIFATAAVLTQTKFRIYNNDGTGTGPP